MPTTLPPIHQFQPQVERLSAEFAAAGTPKTHAELLQLVAVAQGAKSWDDLPQRAPRSWLARKLSRGHYWRRQSLVHRDEVLFDLRMNGLCLGVEAEYKDQSHKQIVVDISWLRRGVLVVGPHGKGAITALEHYLAQQLARGGGLLVLDASPNIDSAEKLRKIATDAGRHDYSHFRHDLPEEPRLDDVAGLLAARGAAYVNLPWESRDGASKTAGEVFAAQLLQHARLPVTPRKTEWPFMVVVPEGGWLLTPAWAPLIQYARQLGIMLAIRLHSLDELSHLSADLAEAVLNVGTQLFLAPNSEAALTSAAQALTFGKGIVELDATRTRLAELGLGAALMRRWGEEPQHVRLCMLTFETREEFWQRRWS